MSGDRRKEFVMDLFGKDDVSLNEESTEDSVMFSDDEEKHMQWDGGQIYSFNSEHNISDTVYTNVVHKSMTLKEAAEEQIIINLISAEGMFPHLSAKREYVNRLPVELKYSVWNRILSDEKLEDEIHVESLEVFLDERTKYFRFRQQPRFCEIGRHKTDKPCLIFPTILKLIPRLAPNIETIDFTYFITTTDLKEDFKFLLKTCTKLKSLHLNSAFKDCPIFDLIFSDINILDREVQIGLQTIKTYNLFVHPRNSSFTLRKLSNIFIRLPNLENVVPRISLGSMMKHYVKFHDTPLNLTHIFDYKTSLATFEIFAKFCPKVKSIYLIKPKQIVVQNLYKLPLLIEVVLSYFDNNELIKYLTRNGEKIKKLYLCNDKPKIDEEQLRQLCPKLKNYN